MEVIYLGMPLSAVTMLVSTLCNLSLLWWFSICVTDSVELLYQCYRKLSALLQELGATT